MARRKDRLVPHLLKEKDGEVFKYD